VKPDERVRLLTAQLLRTENTEVVDLVAEELQQAITDHVNEVKRQSRSILEQIPLPSEAPS
jgi:hypothetical protein